MPAFRPLKERFWEKVDNSGECWVWIGSTTYNGYGEIHWRGKTKRANRISWELHFGEIPHGMRVLHSCDNRRCVRPDHLFIGTDMDNTRDMQRKGRAPLGELQSSTKLTGEQVAEIRRRYGLGFDTYGSLAIDFGVAKSTVSDVIKARTWSHLLEHA